MQERAPKIITGPHKYNFSSVEEMSAPVGKIIERLYPGITNGDYGMVIGDDASGRIPALLIGKIINLRYSETGKDPVEMRFLAGSKGVTGEEKEEKKKKLSEFLRKEIKDGSKKVLIVTDVIDTGVSLDPLVETLKESHIDFDIVSVGDVTTEDVGGRWGKEVIFGESGLPTIFGEQYSSGVRKKPTDLFSTPEKFSEDYSSQEKEDLQKGINEAREDVDFLARDIFSKANKRMEKKQKKD